MGHTKRFVRPINISLVAVLFVGLLALATGTLPAQVEPANAVANPGCVASTGATLHQFTYQGVRYCTEEFRLVSGQVTSSFTWNRPTWVTTVSALVVGGGGNGGSYTLGTGWGGGGGGGGGGVISDTLAVSSATVAITVGCGGGSTGCTFGDGQASSFNGQELVATGGKSGGTSGTGGKSGEGKKNNATVVLEKNGGTRDYVNGVPQVYTGGGGASVLSVGNTPLVQQQTYGPSNLTITPRTPGGPDVESFTWTRSYLLTDARGGSGVDGAPWGINRIFGCGGGGGSSVSWSDQTDWRWYFDEQFWDDHKGCGNDVQYGQGARNFTRGFIFGYTENPSFIFQNIYKNYGAEVGAYCSSAARDNSGGGGGGVGGSDTYITPAVTGSCTNQSSGAAGVVLVRYVAPVPVNTALPTVAPSNTPWVGTTMTRTPGTWTTPINTLTYSGKWVRKSVTNVFTDIPGATFPTYTVTSADIDHELLYVETASNGVFSTSATSSATVKVQGLPVFTAASPPTVADIGYFDGYTFAASGGQVTYAIHPPNALPNGLVFNAATGALTGVPTVSTSAISYQVVATNSVGSATTSALSLTVSDGVVGSMAITTQPVGGPSGSTLTTQPALTLADSAGRKIARPTAVTVSATPAGVTLSGTTTINSSVGFASYTNLGLSGLVGTNYFLVFTSGGFSATSSAVTLTPGAVHSLRIDTQPVSAASAGSALSTQPVLTVLDAQGNVVNDRATTVTVSAVLASSTNTAAGSVGGTQASGLASTNGVLTFTNLTFGGLIGTDYKLKFASGAVSVLSNNVSNSASGAAARLGVITQPAYSGAQTVGSAFTTQPVVSILDAGGNATTSNASVSATASGGVLGGTTAVAGVNGTVTYSDLTFAGLIGTSYTLTFSSPGLASTTSATFMIPNGSTVGAESNLTSTITSSPSSMMANGVSTSAITVQMKDLGGNNVTSSSGTVTLSATSGTLSAVTNHGVTHSATFTAPATRGTGTVTISGFHDGNPMTQVGTITLLSTQTISFTQGNVALGIFPFALTATASSTLPVTYSLGTTTNGACTVTAEGIVAVHAQGSCQIHADQAGDSTFAAAPRVSQTFTVGASTPSAPFITSVTPASGSATVAFTAPGFTGGSAITDYEYSINGGTTWLSATTSASPLTMSGLTNGTSYTVVIRAVNGVGAGLPSDPSGAFSPAGSGAVQVTASATTPTAPRELRVEESSPSTSAVVRWKVPRSDGGSPIINYLVVVNPPVTCTATFIETTGVETCTASDLTPGETYTFTVRAANANGLGDIATISYTVPGGGSNNSGNNNSNNNSNNNGGGSGGGGGGTTTDDDDDNDDGDGDNEDGPGDGGWPGGPSAPPLPGDDDDGDGIPDPWTPTNDPNNVPGRPCSGCIQLFPAPDDDGSPDSDGDGGSGGGTSRPGVTSTPPGSKPGTITVTTGTGTTIVIGGNNPDGKPGTSTSPNGGLIVEPPGNVPIVLSGLKPGTTVTVWLADNLSVTGVVGPDGTVSLLAPIPSGLAAGTYTGRVDMIDADGVARSLLFGFEWRGLGGTLPTTGSDIQSVLLVVMWLLVAGVLIQASSRRRYPYTDCHAPRL